MARKRLRLVSFRKLCLSDAIGGREDGQEVVALKTGWMKGEFGDEKFRLLAITKANAIWLRDSLIEMNLGEAERGE